MTAPTASRPGDVQLVAEGVSFGYPGRRVLDRLDLTVAPGDRIGLVGENGAGKTTLLGVLAGRLHPQEGTVRRHGTLAVVEQDLGFGDDDTIGTLVDETAAAARAAAADLQAVIDGFDHDAGDVAALSAAIARYEHLAAWDVDRRVDEGLSRLQAPRDRDRRLRELSVGERYRVRLACRLAERADLLLLDEPTNHLDADGVAHLTAQLRAWVGGLVIVTHDRRLLDDVMTAILDMDPSMDGRPVLYGAARYADYRFARDQMLRRWRARYRAERKRARVLAERLDASYEGLSDEWRPPKGSQTHRRATRARQHVKAADRLIERLEAQAVDVPVPPPALRFPDLPSVPPAYAGGPLLEVRGPRVAGRLDMPGRRVAVMPAGRLLVTGPNGAGKSTLLAALVGSVGLDRGTRTVASGVRWGVLVQEGPGERTAPAGGSSPTAFDAYARHALDLLEAGALDPDALVPVAALGLLTETDLDRPLRELSIGQRRRFDLACALLAAPHVLVLDEPTNHLSVGLVDDLTTALRETSAAVVVATHDRQLRADLADWPRLELGA
ncbi:ABC-F family ATP-binding cassette domain-containing protein [Cellulomonas xiejunii]|uniref:ATP-binding cassette domain-containing protein n=1 Tax=Cellulomonas xiejunii TaxID=2968083 RepID=A0ABY5KRK2_9CELL|nr:ATP-binding cassette domain-containing protein [Cellulomonas xiejunii]MCC2315738.1 ATP-binding cassette domain-containing protein [Cellulomonas xiejunii]MCC2321802.1 ATP-binding cassette domain-containing protein [Cellulomonas xiejunii]UUI73107.1 ATP-binding cassette domain-containing protein [Cellulomonas xiejunii]